MPRRTRIRFAFLASAAAAALCMPPSAAHAAAGAEVSIMDDQLLLGRSQSFIDRQIGIFNSLGVDRLRVSAFWDGNAPAPNSSRKPAGFDGANANDPRYRWSALDRVVGSAVAHGIKVMISITTPAPRWATTGHRKGGLWKPSAREFGAFAEAVARRYGSMVDQYGISNEPNQGGWLQPQSTSRGLVAPHLYRAMEQAAYPRIKAADPTSVALIGNLASSGSNVHGRRAPIRPLAFLRAMACVNSRYRPIRGGACRGFTPVPADAVAHHPYRLFGSPYGHSRSRDDAAIGDSRRLLRVLDRLVRLGRIRPSGGQRLNVYYTEFGYQTDPPDPFAGVPLGRQSRYLQQAAYLAWRTPRIRGINQFRLTDGRLSGRGLSAFREFQSGLLFANRRPKPAFRSFPHPFVISGSRFWGQVRPGGAHSVAIEHRAGRGGFRTVRSVQTDAAGYFSVRLARRRGQWRYVYSDGPRGASDTLTVH
jgi:cellulase (glycosyl hydrolase family 5)